MFEKCLQPQDWSFVENNSSSSVHQENLKEQAAATRDIHQTFLSALTFPVLMPSVCAGSPTNTDILFDFILHVCCSVVAMVLNPLTD